MIPQEIPGRHASIKMTDPDETANYNWPACYTLTDYVNKYGETNVLILLEQAERKHYEQQAADLVAEGEVLQNSTIERTINAQVLGELLSEPFLNGNWKPLDDRAPTEVEELAQKVMDLPLFGQTQFTAIVNTKAAEKQAAAQNEAAELAQQQHMANSEKWNIKEEEVEAPVTDSATQEPLQSFQDMANEAYNGTIVPEPSTQTDAEAQTAAIEDPKD